MLQSGTEAALPASAVDPYGDSVAATLLRERIQRGLQPRLACLDIDSTLTGSEELADRVRLGLEARGFAVSFITSRTEEMIMSSTAFERSREAGFSRPPPKLGRASGRQVYVAPETVVPAGLLDGAIIAGSSGTRILLRQRDGSFVHDEAYEGELGVPADRWRRQTLALLAWAQEHGCRAEVAPIDDPDSYERGESDVFPPDYRVQVNFPSLEEKGRFLAQLATAKNDRVAGSSLVRVTDDSNPAEGRIKVFLTPRRASKARAAQTIIAGLCRAAQIERGALQVLFAGDSFPDLHMGLLGGTGTAATFLLAGGSRLVAPLVGDAAVFAGEPLRAIRRRIEPAGEPGRYCFRTPLQLGGSRTLLVGDEVFPGTQAVETVAAYVESLSSEIV